MSKYYLKSSHRELFGYSRRDDARQPMYFCTFCNYFSNDRCLLFNRHVVKDFNRCFNHSNYISLKFTFTDKSNEDKLSVK